MIMHYDLIGDIHGCHETLHALLAKLGYTLVSGVYQHLTNKIIFLGDFVDRGPGQREVLAIVRPMVEQGHALAVMGNHEFNAIAYATQADDGQYLREHSEKNNKQHRVFLDAYESDPDAYQDTIGWFKTLPLWLDLETDSGALRVIHACWDQSLIDRLAAHYAPHGVLTDALLHESNDEAHWAFHAIETLLKGKEIPLQQGLYFHDKDGNKRHRIRIKWWDQTATTYQQAHMGPASFITHIPDDEITGDHLVEYGHHLPPVFLGHYWMDGKPAVLAPNIACLDYSVARPGGQLVAYRWQGEQVLSDEHFVSIDRVDKE